MKNPAETSTESSEESELGLEDDDTRLPLWLFGSATTFNVLMFFGILIGSLYEKKDTSPETEQPVVENQTFKAIQHFLTDLKGLPDAFKKDPELNFTHMVGGKRDENWVYDLTLKKASPATHPEIGYNEAIGTILTHAKEHLESENPESEVEFSIVFLAGEIPATLTLELKHKQIETEQTTAPAAVGIITSAQLESPSPRL